MTAVVRNTKRTTVTQSAAWMRGRKKKGASDARMAVVEESEGEKKRGERGGVGRFSFEWRQGEAGEGWGSTQCRVGAGEGAERGAGVWHYMGWHGTGVAAPSHSDSGGW
jgi:hypothetical protein